MSNHGYTSYEFYTKHSDGSGDNGVQFYGFVGDVDLTDAGIAARAVEILTNHIQTLQTNPAEFNIDRGIITPTTSLIRLGSYYSTIQPEA